MLCLVSSGIALLLRRFSLQVTKEAVSALRRDLMTRLLSAPRAALTGADLERLHTVLVQDSERVDVMSNALLLQVFPSVVTVAGLSTVILVLSPPLFLCVAATAPPLTLGGRLLGKRLRPQVQAYVAAFSTYSAGVLFALQHHDLIR